MKLNGNLTFKTLGDELRNAVIERLAADPTATTGRIYYHTGDNEYRYYNGTSWQPFGEGVIASNIVTASGGIYETDGTYDGTAVDAALGNVTSSTDLLDALSQLDQAVSGAAESYRIKDADADTIVRTALTGGGDEDEVQIILGDNGDSKGPETIATFGRTSTAIKGLDATAGNTAGADVSLTGGAGNADGYGGSIAIDGGAGYYGGTVDISGGSATTLNGGQVSITGGTTASGAQYGGDIYITGGTGNSYGGGRVFIDGGSGLKDGDVYITSGGTSDQTQRIYLYGSADDGDTAGNIDILAADSALSASAGGNINIAAGDGGATGDGGSINLSVHAGTTNDGIISLSSTDAIAPELRFAEATGSEYVAMHAPAAITTSVTYTLPVTPTAGYVLQTTAAGVLSWVDPSGVTSLAFDDLTDVDVASPTDKDLVQWDSGGGEWIDVAIGSASGVQAYDAGLDSIAGLTASNGNIIYATAADTYAVAAPGVTSGVQAYDAGLDSLAGLGASSGDVIYATAADTYAVAQPGTTSGVQAWDINLDQIAALAPTTDNFIVGTGSAWALETPADARTSLGLVAGGTGDIWVEKAGDIMDSAANISFSGGGEVLGLPTVPSVGTAATSKDYVDQLVAAGTVWEDPIVDPNLTGISATANPSTEANATWIAFDGSYPQVWGSITDVEEGDVLVRNSTDDDWIRIELVSTSSRFIVTADLQTNLSETDPLFVAGVRSKDLIQFESTSVVSGEIVAYAAINWFLPSQDTYQVIDFTTPKATGDSTGLANDATVYTFQVALNGTGAADNISVVGSAAQTIATLLTGINTDLDAAFGASNVIATLEDEGHIHITGQAISDYILITPSAGTDLLNALTDYNEIRGSNVNGTTVLVSEPDSPNFGNQYTYSERGNDWTLIAGPGTVTAGTGLSKSGTVLNVNMGSGIVELPSDQVGVDLRNSASGAILLTTDGTTREGSNAASQLWLRLAGDDGGVDTNGSALTQDTEGLRLVLTANSGLTINGAGTNNGTLEVAPKTATGIAINGGDGELELTAIPNASLTNSGITSSDGTNTDEVALGETQVATGAIVGANTIKYRRIEDSDGDTAVQVSSAHDGDEDTVQIILGDNGDDFGPETVADFGRAASAIKGLDATAATISGGAVTLTGGDGLTTGAGGAVTLTGGDSGAAGTGGDVTLTAGIAGTAGTGGGVTITASGTTSSDFQPGDIVIDAGSTLETGTAGGGVAISAGDTAATGVGGNVTLTAGQGNSGTGTAGIIELDVRAGTAADGYLSLTSTDSLAPELRFAEQTGSEYVGFKAPDAVTAAVTYTLPEAPAANGYVMASTTAGVMSWVSSASIGATRLEDLLDVTASTSGSPQDSVGDVLVFDGTDSYDSQALQFNYDSTLNGGASTSHTVSHSLGQRFVNVTVFDSSFNQVIPQTVVLTDTNTVTVTFNSSIQCYVVVMGIAGIALA